MELHIWPSDFGLPSVEPECLQFLACARFCAAPVTVTYNRKPWKSDTGKYPMLKSNETSLSDFDEFVEFMKKNNQDVVLDGHLGDVEKCELYAYAAWLRNKLWPAYLYTMWMDDANFHTVANRWYARNVMFPFNMWYIHKRRWQAIDVLRQNYPGKHVLNQDIKHAVNLEACMCLNLLSAKLGDKKYFYGDRPTSLDALVFGYLAPFLKLPIPNDRLQTHLKGCPNLVRFIESIISIYLPLTDEEITSQRGSLIEWEMRKAKAQEEIRQQKQDERHSKQQHEEEQMASKDEFRTRDKVLFGMSALVITILAALHFGVIQIEVQDGSGPEEGGSVSLPEGVDFDFVS